MDQAFADDFAATMSFIQNSLPGVCCVRSKITPQVYCLSLSPSALHIQMNAKGGRPFNLRRAGCWKSVLGRNTGLSRVVRCAAAR